MEELEHQEAIAILGGVLVAAVRQMDPDEINDSQRACVYGLAWAVGMLLDPPEDGAVMIRAHHYAREAFIWMGAEILWSEVEDELRG
jgi:hypothetical protein